MNDLISRQAAIDFIDAGHLVNPNEPRWSDNEVVGFLKSRPPAQPEDKCSECDAWNKYKNYPSAEPELATNLQPSCNQLATDCISRQAAIDAFYTQSDDDGWWTGTVQDAEELLKGLPSAEPENADCIYCHEDSDGYVKPIEKNCHAFIHFGMNGWCLELSAKGWHGETKINYCPMCGRKL